MTTLSSERFCEIFFFPSRVCFALSSKLQLVIVSSVVYFFSCRVVEFASYSDLKNAIEKLSGKEINGRKIKLIEGSKRHRYGFLFSEVMLH